jgi:hypothetical protein
MVKRGRSGRTGRSRGAGGQLGLAFVLRDAVLGLALSLLASCAEKMTRRFLAARVQ